MKTQISMLFIIVSLNSLSVKAQTWQWANKAGGIENDYANAVDVDNLGNSYIAGKFLDSATFGSVTLFNPGVWSVYIAKFDASGNLVWAKIAASDSSISVSSLSIDYSGNIFLAGQYFGTATFGISPVINLNSTADYDVFAAKYNPTGDLLWAKSLGGQGIDYAGSISADISGNTYLTGDFHLSSFPFSSSKIFISKYDSLGNNLWLKTEINYGLDHFGNSIKADLSGNIFLTGEFFDTILIDSSVIIGAGNVESNAFLAKFDSSGNVIWAQKAGAASGYCGSKAIDIDSAGNSYIMGYYHGTISLGSFSITSVSGIANEVFVAKCDSGGNFAWVNKSIGAGNSRSISLDNSGNVYVSGTFQQTITFGATSLNSTGSDDIFLTELNPSGNFIWATSCGGLQSDIVGGIKVNSNGISLTGYFLDTIHFGNSFSLVDTSSVKSDIFIASLNTSSGIEEEKNYSNVYSCYPNPAESEIQFPDIIGNEKYILFDCLGKIILQGTFDGKNKIAVENLKGGIYFICLKTDNKTRQFKFIKN